MHSIPLAEDDVTPTLADPALDLSADLRGTLVAGRHELAELFFHGEQGSVYLGRDTHSNRPVEVKILASEAATTAAVDRFRERSRRMLGLSHPGIAPVLSEGITENGLPFVVMEHREGRNLLHLMGDPRVAWPAPETIVRQLAEALAALHALGVVHGSVSAGNIVWIDDAGASPRVQLVDREFQVPAADEFASFSRPGDSSTREPTAADDLHALGQVVYELCTGSPPPPHGPLGMRQPDAQVAVPESFESVILALLDRDPASRPASAVGLLDLLDRASGMHPGDLDFLAALGEPEPEHPPPGRFTRPPAERFATLPPASATATSATSTATSTPSRFVVTEAPPPSPMDTSSSAAHALAAAMDAFDSDDPPERQRVPIPEPRPAPVREPVATATERVPAEVPTFATPEAPAPSASASEPAHPAPLDPTTSDTTTSTAQASATTTSATPASATPASATTTPTPALTEPTTATRTAVSEPATSPARPAPAPAPPLDRRLLLIALAVGALLLLLAWQLRSDPTPDPTPDPTSKPPPVAAPPHAGRRVPDPPEPEVTLASGAAPALPAAPEPAPTPDPTPDVAPPTSADAESPALEQLSAGEFRKLMLRSNRSEAVRSCYRKHARPGEENIEVIALVTPAGRIQKPRTSPEIPLADCLRKLIVKLEFPTATRPAQHNFVYRHPDSL